MMRLSSGPRSRRRVSAEGPCPCTRDAWHRRAIERFAPVFLSRFGATRRKEARQVLRTGSLAPLGHASFLNASLGAAGNPSTSINPQQGGGKRGPGAVASGMVLRTPRPTARRSKENKPSGLMALDGHVGADSDFVWHSVTSGSASKLLSRRGTLEHPSVGLSAKGVKLDSPSSPFPEVLPAHLFLELTT